jgi:BirA family transcriptional regulator, biotin operon repressor / biotin---[acetyl-CoA-carboxylase] ligase
VNGTDRRGSLPPDFADALALRAGRCGGLASRVVWFDTVSSTNDAADQLASAGAEHGTVVAADEQLSGRGRMGRVWHSPPGAGLYVSVVLKPASFIGSAERGTTSAASRITLTAGVALADALRVATGLPAAIKWPNDLVVGRRKVCGILAEGAATGETLRHVILGFGVNVLTSAYPPEIADRATSIEAELGRPADRGAVFAESLACLAERLRESSAGGFDAVLDAWRALSPSSIGARVQISRAGGWIDAVTEGIDRDGALVVRAEGSLHRVIAGEVRWVAPTGPGSEDSHAPRA